MYMAGERKQELYSKAAAKKMGGNVSRGIRHSTRFSDNLCPNLKVNWPINSFVMKVVNDCDQHPSPLKMELTRDGGSGGRGGGQPTKGGNTGGEVRKWKWKFLRGWKSQSESFCGMRKWMLFFWELKKWKFLFFFSDFLCLKLKF